MSEENTNDTPAATAAPAFDPVKFKTEMLESVAEQNRVMLETVLASKTTPSEPARPVTAAEDGFDLNEFESEMAQINVDENQMKGILKVVSKVLSKAAPKLRDEIDTHVDNKLVLQNNKIEITRDLKMQFPDIANPKSALYQQAKIEYRKLSAEARAGYDAEAQAVKNAALELGIRPLKLSDVKSRDATMPTGDGGLPEKKTHEIDKSFASFFNVDVNKANEKFKEIMAKQSAH